MPSIPAVGPVGIPTFAKLATISILSDLPEAVAGVITLLDGYHYDFTQDLDLLGSRLVCAGVVSIAGTSSETVILSSTGLVGTALLTSIYTLPMRNITITADIAVDINGDGTIALDWFAVNFEDCPVIGTIRDFDNFIMSFSAFLNSGPLTFDGVFGTSAFDTTFFNARAASSVIIVAATATISRRLRIVECSFVVLAGETGIKIVDDTVFTNSESYILSDVNFSGGGTYLDTTTYTSPKALFRMCVGITNSASVAHYYMNNNATATVIAITGTAVKIAGTTTDGPNVQQFTQTDNKGQSTGHLTEFFQVSVSASLTSGNNNQLSIYIAKNGVLDPASKMTATANAGGRLESVQTISVISLGNTDYFEVWLANETSTTNVVVENLQVIAKKIG